MKTINGKRPSKSVPSYWVGYTVDPKTKQGNNGYLLERRLLDHEWENLIKNSPFRFPNRMEVVTFTSPAEAVREAKKLTTDAEIVRVRVYHSGFSDRGFRPGDVRLPDLFVWEKPEVEQP